MDPFIGEIRLLPYTFAPADWLDCAGQLAPISQYQTLFAIISTTYGGDGQTTFGIPDLRGRAAPGFGDDPTDTFDPPLGSTGGSEAVTLTAPNIPQHTHTLKGATQPNPVRTSNPANNYISQVNYRPAGGGTTTTNPFFDNSSTTPTLTALNPGSITPYSGLSQGHENRQPYLGLRYCICVNGTYPVRP